MENGAFNKAPKLHYQRFKAGCEPFKAFNSFSLIEKVSNHYNVIVRVTFLTQN